MKVLLIDDHALFRAGVMLLLREAMPGIEILQASTLRDGVAIALSQALNLVFLDLELPDGNGLDALEALKRQRPSLPVVIMSADERVETIVQALAFNAMGFVPKSQPPEVLQAALHSALAGGVFLPVSVVQTLAGGQAPFEAEIVIGTGRQEERPGGCANRLGLSPRLFETLGWLAQGLPSKTIAVRMGLEDITVRKYVSQLLTHFNVRRRTELIVLLANNQVSFGPPPLSQPALDGH
jgi:DNA-binding NarL/FixJ family response regulator